MAQRYTNGFETGDVSRDGTTPTRQSSVVYTGSYAYEIDVSQSTRQHINFLTVGENALDRTWFIRAYVRFSSLPPAPTTKYFMQLTEMGGAVICDLGVSYTGAVNLSSNGTDTRIVSSAGVIQVNTWHCVELSVKLSDAANDQAEIRIDGSSVGSLNGFLNTYDGVRNVHLGSVNRTNNYSWDSGSRIYVDDVAVNDSTGVSDNSWPGTITPVTNVTVNTNAATLTLTAMAAEVTSVSAVNITVEADTANIAFTTFAVETVGDNILTTSAAALDFKAIAGAYGGADLWESYGLTVKAIPDLAIYWRLEDATTATSLIDSSGNGNHASPRKAGTNTRSQGAVGSDTHYALASTREFQWYTPPNPDEITIDFWWYNAGPFGQRLIEDAIPTSDPYTGPLLPDFTWNAASENTNPFLDHDHPWLKLGATTHVTWDDPPVTAGWNHFSLVCTLEDVYLSINGVFVPISRKIKQTRVTPSDPWTYESDPTLAIYDGWNGLRLVSGIRYDEIAVYSRALSPGEVAGLHASAGEPTPATVSVDNTPIVSLAAHDVQVTSGIEITLTVSNVPRITFEAHSIALLINGALIIGAETANISLVGHAPTTDLVRHITVDNTPGVMAYRGVDATIRLNTQDLEFRFVPVSETAFTARDAATLDPINLGSMLYGQEKVFGFRLANTSLEPTHFVVEPRSDNNIVEMVGVSTNKSDWYTGVVIEAVPANGITDIIWVKLVVGMDAYVDEATFMIHVEQTNA